MKTVRFFGGPRQLYPDLLDHQRAGRVPGSPGDVKAYGINPMGYPAKDGTSPKRRAIEEFLHRNGW